MELCGLFPTLSVMILIFESTQRGMIVTVSVELFLLLGKWIHSEALRQCILELSFVEFCSQFSFSVLFYFAFVTRFPACVKNIFTKPMQEPRAVEIESSLYVVEQMEQPKLSNRWKAFRGYTCRQVEVVVSVFEIVIQESRSGLSSPDIDKFPRFIGAINSFKFCMINEHESFPGNLWNLKQV